MSDAADPITLFQKYCLLPFEPPPQPNTAYQTGKQ